MFSAENLLSPAGITVPKYCLKMLRVLTQRRVGVQEDDALGLQVLADLVVNHLGVVHHQAFSDEVVRAVHLDVVHRFDGMRLDRLDPLEAEPVVAVHANRRAVRAIRRV